MDGKTLDLGFGKEVWIGNFSCVRPYGWKDHDILVTLNVDTAHKPAARNLHLTNESGPGKIIIILIYFSLLIIKLYFR